MPLCLRCLKVFTTRQQLLAHLFKKVPCEPCGIILEDKSIKCKFCKKEFDRQSNLDKHLNNTKTACFTERTHKESVSQTIINNITNLTNQKIEQINNIIHPSFAKHGQESIDHITREVLLELLNSDSFTNLCSTLMKLLYFNVNVPQNINWMIAYPKNGKAGVSFNYDTDQFERISTIDMIDDKFSNMINLLQPLIERICREDERDNILNTKQRRNISKFFEHVGMLEISKESPEVYAKIHDMAYNYKPISAANWKKQGLNANHLSIKF